MVCALEGIIAKHDAIKCEVGPPRDPVEKMMTTKSGVDSENGWNREEEREEEFSGGSAEVDDDSVIIRTIVPHELERFEEEDEEQMVKEEKEDEREERRMRRVELGRPRTPKPTGLGMSRLSKDDDRCSISPSRH